MEPIVQIAIDTTIMDDALRLAHCAVEAGADWLEVGNPLIKFEGVRSIEVLAKEFPEHYILVDFMVMAGSKRYIDIAKKLGAHNITVTGLVPDTTISEAISYGKESQIETTIDLFNVQNIADDAIKYKEMGADYLMVHFGVDQKKNLEVAPIEDLKRVVELVDIPVSYATYDLEESIQAVKAGAKVIVQGYPLLSTPNPTEALKKFIVQTKEASRNIIL
ncbi:orotidine 5'-phosphate decarboxylase / HUMPS family protein [Fredinandcohnia onubensis]|uniref:orotidine 5'-phosphate decarboxylase / HUMPS family protein n=1 Tax=Fredinandcohnia onubensis TaxID=1571209 RepID=UPI000C0BCF16